MNSETQRARGVPSRSNSSDAYHLNYPATWQLKDCIVPYPRYVSSNYTSAYHEGAFRLFRGKTGTPVNVRSCSLGTAKPAHALIRDSVGLTLSTMGSETSPKRPSDLSCEDDHEIRYLLALCMN
ncbi:hypothetical protein HRR88_002021 [Exophiala dermatitidis]|nr:hypothetical protein HRR84_001706 [Exophiala dermatitidis]KAJ4629840.1 hypothetical protein HRR88_002021 [Exophiala dermatitidis]KAJ4650425.1 hypothetical protein HRR89_000503 [Exophiala dermatitidis]KAJ4658743.1 hypothetical protein HRR91_001109 [Exophiala dermatitidis]KAJ4685147.1 hypothetical protein HRR92_001705 [Exophiala dermatitidis]